MFADIKTPLVKATLKPILNVMMELTNLTEGGSQTATFKFCSPTLTTGIRQELVYLSAVNIFLSVTAILGNALILVALHKESSLHPPSKLLYRCLATTDLCVGLVTQPAMATCWMSLVHEDWSLCRYVYVINFVSTSILVLVSLLTLTAISVDRLLALLLGLRYRQVVTLKRIYMIVATFWVVSGVAAAMNLVYPLITFWYSNIGMLLCLGISIASYTKIFLALSHHQTEVKDHVQQQPGQPNALNMARYRKAVYSALWVQIALVVCYVPFSIMRVLLIYSALNPSRVLAWAITVVLAYLNSTLNPFLYCWKISEVRQAVKQTIRQALCCPWS